MDHLGKSDLIVLDYHLDPLNHSDPGKALRILRHLADTSHANLVILYTNAPNLEEVRLQIAVNLRGGTPPSIADSQALQEYEDFLSTWQAVPRPACSPTSDWVYKAWCLTVMSYF